MNRDLARRAFVMAALLISMLVPFAANAQPTAEAPAAIYIEAGGNGLKYSLNYEGRVSKHFAGRVGFAFINVTVPNEDTGEESQIAVTLMPVMANALLGSGAARLEVGVGPLISIRGTGVDRIEQNGASVEFDSDFDIAGITSAMGLRYQPRQGGFMFRATVTPFYSGRAQVWGGLSLGWAI